jgi:hypothetical protein
MKKEDNIKKSTYEVKILEKHNVKFSEVQSNVTIQCMKDVFWDFNAYNLPKFLCRINCRPQHQYPQHRHCSSRICTYDFTILCLSLLIAKLNKQLHTKKHILFLVGLIKLITSLILLPQLRTDVINFCNRKDVFLWGGEVMGLAVTYWVQGGFFSFEEKAHSFKVV